MHVHKYDLCLQVAEQSFTAHKFILGSQAHDFITQLVPCDDLSPSTFKLQKKCDNPDVFDAFLHYIYGNHVRLVPPSNTHSHPVSPCPSHTRTNIIGNDPLWDGMESTPDTSFTSVDENDLTEEYDKYCSNANELQEEWTEIEVCYQYIVWVLHFDPTISTLQSPVVVGQSTPRKKSHLLSAGSRSRNRNSVSEDGNDIWGESVKVLQLGNRRLDAKSLLQLATNFDLTHLKKS